MSILRLAGRTLRRGWPRTALTVFVMLLSVLMLSSVWTQYASLKEDIYLSVMSPWDYSITDGSAYYSVQQYNQENKGITDETVREMAARPEVTSVSALKSREVELTASPELVQRLADFYNGSELEDGTSRREEMEGYPDWQEGLARLEDTGEQVVLEGQAFTVLGSTTMDTSLLSGGNSRQAAFCLYYFVPPQVFDAMFPDQGIRQLAVNIDHSQQDSFEAYLDEYEQGLYQGIGITRRSEYQANFVSARLNTVLASLIVGIVFGAIALLNFMNLLAAKALSRKQEFAVYESLGMSRSQLKRLVFLEGILYGALMAVVIIPVTVLFEYFVMPGVIENIGSWAMVYTFTLMPMGIIVPLIAVCSIAVPMLCLHLITRGSIIQRMHVIE